MSPSTTFFIPAIRAEIHNSQFKIKLRSEAGVAFFFYFILIRKTYYH
jgi:hypothetical protein